MEGISHISMKLMNRILGTNDSSDSFEVFRMFPGYSELYSDLDHCIAG